jgi:hypothetical protein
MPNTPWYNQSPIQPRIAGAFLLGFGVVGLFLGIVAPALSRHAPSFFGLALSAGGVPCLVFGAAYIVCGAHAIRYLGEPQALRTWRARYWAPLVAIGVISFIFLWWRLRA